MDIQFFETKTDKKTDTKKKYNNQLFINEKILNKLEEVILQNKNLQIQNNQLKDRLIKIEEYIKTININKNTKETKPLIKEFYNIDKITVLKYLKFRDSRTIIYLMRKFYNKCNITNKYIYPIKCNGKNGFKYYNIKWINDPYAYNIIEILFNNIIQLLLKYNTWDNVPNMNDFMENQNFIYNMNTDKFKRNFINYLRNEIIRNE